MGAADGDTESHVRLREPRVAGRWKTKSDPLSWVSLPLSEKRDRPSGSRSSPISVRGQSGLDPPGLLGSGSLAPRSWLEPTALEHRCNYKTTTVALGVVSLVLIIILTALAVLLSGCSPAVLGPWCLDGWVGYQGKCFYFSKGEGNWTDSRSNCSALGASLAGIDTLQEMDFLLRFKGKPHHWIGLRRDPGQPWKWLNGTEFNNLELETLLDLWQEEEGLHDTRSRRHNADIYGLMAQALAQQGHPAQNLEQVRAKVKELRLGYVWASEIRGAGPDTCPHYDWLHGILGQPAPDVPVDICQRPPITRTTEAGKGDSSASEEQAPSSSSSEAGEGSTAGSSTSWGHSSPAAVAPPAAQPCRHRLRHRDQLLRHHVLAVERIKASIRERVQQWRQEAWAAFQAECTRMADSIATLTARIAHAIHYGMALPHAPAIPIPAMAPAPMPPPASAIPPAPVAPEMPAPPAAPEMPPAPAHLPVQPAPMQPAPHVQVCPRRSAPRGHPSQE